MALIKCPECGKDISDKSLTCIHCGYPLANKHVSSAKIFRKKTFIVVLSIALVIAIIFSVLCLESFKRNQEPSIQKGLETERKRSEQATDTEENNYQSTPKDLETEQQRSEQTTDVEENVYQSMIVNSRENITPYLDYIGRYYKAGETIDLPSDLYNNMKNVEFMGMKGEIAFGTTATSKKDDYYVRYCSWTSFEGYSEKEFQSIAEELNNYFNCEADIDSRDYSKGHTYRYFWIDPNNEYHVTCGHGLFVYTPDGSIEVLWALEFCEGAEFFGW